MDDLRGEHANIDKLFEDIAKAQPADYGKTLGDAETNYGKYRDTLYKMRKDLPMDVKRLIDQIGNTSPRDPNTLAALHEQLLQKTSFVSAMADLGPSARDRLTAMGDRYATIADYRKELSRLKGLQDKARANIADLQQKYRDIGGRQQLGVELHVDLPDPQAPAGYSPETSRLKKFKEKLGDAMGDSLMKAIQDIVYLQDPTAFNVLAKDPKIAQALGYANLGECLISVMAHVNGYRSELSLASRIAEGKGGLPGKGKHTVLDFGDPIGANHADILSVDEDGNVFLWDSKYRTTGSAGEHSDTFKDGSKRLSAREDAEKILNDPSRTSKLTIDQREKAKAHIAAGKFFAVTSHTNDVFNFSDSKPLRVVNDEITP